MLINTAVAYVRGLFTPAPPASIADRFDALWGELPMAANDTIRLVAILRLAVERPSAMDVALKSLIANDPVLASIVPATGNGLQAAEWTDIMAAHTKAFDVLFGATSHLSVAKVMSGWEAGTAPVPMADMVADTQRQFGALIRGTVFQPLRAGIGRVGRAA